MSSQTSNSRFQTSQQSRAVCSIPSLLSSLEHRTRSLASSNFSGAPKNMAPAYFEEYGLHVPLRKFGQKRLHARSASELAGKNKQALIDIARDITNSQVSKFKSASRSELALYIERVETLALGPHPKTTLPSTRKEDLVEALGLKIKAQRARCNKVEKPAPRQKPAFKKASGPAEDKVIAQSIVDFSARKNKPEQRSAPIQQATPPAAPLKKQTAPAPVSARKQISHTTPIRSAEVVQKTNKRRHDNADAPADTEQAPAKKTRVISKLSSKPSGLSQMKVIVATKAPVSEFAPRAPSVIAEQASQDQSVAPKPPSSASASAPSPLILEERKDLDLDTKQSRGVSSVIRDLEAHTIPARAKTTDERAACFASNPHNTLNSPIPHNTQHVTDLACFSRCSSDDRVGRGEQEPERPFLKPGLHGRKGDFENDPDRATGRGHQVDPKDLARRRAYDIMYRTWKHRVTEADDGLEELRREEVWMSKYREKYPGEVVGHLWDCGCEKVMDGDESEEE